MSKRGGHGLEVEIQKVSGGESVSERSYNSLALQVLKATHITKRVWDRENKNVKLFDS